LERVDALITQFMSETSARLRLVFDAVTDVRGVYCLDEFDALGSQRATPNDVGEARPILNGFLQMIEQGASRWASAPSAVCCYPKIAHGASSPPFGGQRWHIGDGTALRRLRLGL
jgi:hypothetical protein